MIETIASSLALFVFCYANRILVSFSRQQQNFSSDKIYEFPFLQFLHKMVNRAKGQLKPRNEGLIKHFLAVDQINMWVYLPDKVRGRLLLNITNYKEINWFITFNCNIPG